MSTGSFAIFGVILAILCAPAPRVITQSARDAHDSDIRELQRLEIIWNTAHENGDANALENLWADDLEVAVPRMAVLTKATSLAFARSGQMKFTHYATSDLNIRVYGEAAVVTGRLERIRVRDGRETSDDWRFTKVYMREGGKWLVVSFHASEAARP